MVKDRLADFRKPRFDSESSEKSLNGLAAKLQNDMFLAEQEKLLENDDSSTELHEFFDRVDEVRDSIVEMRSCLETMKKNHSKILLEPGVHPQFTDELNEHVENFKALSKDNRARVQAMKRSSQEADVETSMGRIIQNQILYISQRLLEVLSAFNEEQVRYKEKCKRTIVSFLAVSGREMPEDDIDMAIESGRLFDYTKGMMLAHNDKIMLYEEAKSRHEDIIRLESSILELHEIFQDMSMLVESQGQIVDNIEMNVGSAADYASKARSNVRKALAAQRGSRKKKILLLIFCLIFVLIAFFVGSSLFCFYVPICGGR